MGRVAAWLLCASGFVSFDRRRLCSRLRSGFGSGANLHPAGRRSIRPSDGRAAADDRQHLDRRRAAGVAGNDIVITGIRASLRQSMDIKKNAQGVVDAISAEEMGKFPDTNLAESLQRITGVSIDRSNGEGSFVTVRGFGPEYNLVLLNGRQMPTSSLSGGGGERAQLSRVRLRQPRLGRNRGGRSLQVGPGDAPTGGIGATINIKTPRPLDRPACAEAVGERPSSIRRRTAMTRSLRKFPGFSATPSPTIASASA